MLTTQMLTIFWPKKDYKHTFYNIYAHFQGIINNIYGFGRLFLLLNFLSVHPSIFVFSRPNDGWTGLCIKLWWGVRRRFLKEVYLCLNVMLLSSYIYSVKCHHIKGKISAKLCLKDKKIFLNTQPSKYYALLHLRRRMTSRRWDPLHADSLHGVWLLSWNGCNSATRITCWWR